MQQEDMPLIGEMAPRPCRYGDIPVSAPKRGITTYCTFFCALPVTTSGRPDRRGNPPGPTRGLFFLVRRGGQQDVRAILFHGLGPDAVDKRQIFNPFKRPVLLAVTHDRQRFLRTDTHQPVDQRLGIGTIDIHRLRGRGRP